ncbi:MAG: YwaF family protein, partial [Clostridia bacterium]|nr:YwaF family protein [Clostridia bacterium]
MFSLEHILWLIISTAIIVGVLFAQEKFKFSYRFMLNTMLVVSILSETTKILCNMMDAPDGRTGKILDPGDLPFHLCSIQIFLLFGLKFLIKKEETKEKMLAFMCPTMIIGAVMAFFVPTVGVEFTVVQVYQYFIFHAFLIIFSIYILKEKLVKWTWKHYLHNLAYLGGLAMLMMWINSALSGVLG